MRELAVAVLAGVLLVAQAPPVASRRLEAGGWTSPPQSTVAPVALGRDDGSTSNRDVRELPTLRSEGVAVGMDLAPQLAVEMVVDRSSLVSSLACHRDGVAWRCEGPGQLEGMTWLTGALYLNALTAGPVLRLGAGAGPAFAQYELAVKGQRYAGGGPALSLQAFATALLASWGTVSLTASVRWAWFQVPLRLNAGEERLLLPVFRAGLSVIYSL